nr:MAG TPA: hypothetical protein [Caudoviricetes sp.]
MWYINNGLGEHFYNFQYETSNGYLSCNNTKTRKII